MFVEPLGESGEGKTFIPGWDLPRFLMSQPSLLSKKTRAKQRRAGRHKEEVCCSNASGTVPLKCIPS